MNTKNIFTSSILATTVLTACDTVTPSTEITTEEIPAKIIIKKTENAVEKILEISQLCQNENIKILDYHQQNNVLSIAYDCDDDLELNGVTQFPKIPGIPTGTPLPHF